MITHLQLINIIIIIKVPNIEFGANPSGASRADTKVQRGRKGKGKVMGAL